MAAAASPWSPASATRLATSMMGTSTRIDLVITFAYPHGRILVRTLCM